MTEDPKTWSRHHGPWFLWKLEIEDTWVTETWTNDERYGPVGRTIWKRSWPMHSEGWRLLELRATLEWITEVWEVTPIPSSSGTGEEATTA